MSQTEAIAPIQNAACQIYRHFDASGTLLYVGISISAIGRLVEHASTAPWYLQIARVEIQNFSNRQSALEAEKRAIKEEKPKFNKFPGRPKGTRGTCQFTIILDVEMFEQIERAAIAAGLSKGEVIRRALERGLPDRC